MDERSAAQFHDMGRLLRCARLTKIGVFLGTSGTDGGAFQYSDAVLEAVATITARDHDVVVRYVDPAWARIVSAYGLHGLPIRRSRRARVRDGILRRAPVPVSVWRRALSRAHTITRAIEREHCDVWIFPAQDIWTYLAPVHAIGTIHDLMHRYEARFPEVSERGMFRRRERHYRRMCRWARAVLVDSDVGREQVLESYRVNPAKLFVLPYIASRHVRSAGAANETSLRLPDKFFFYPAQFWQHKNHATLVSAIAKVRDRHADVRLVLAGAPKNGYADIRRQVAALGLRQHVVFLGYVSDDDMPALYRRARALVMPTFFGPTNIPQLEAFVLGCPVATSRIYGIPDQVGDAALLFDPHSVDETADILERLWTDDSLCATLVERGHRKAEVWGAREFGNRLNDIIRTVETERG